jgi:GT2 family glycosyltransferase
MNGAGAHERQAPLVTVVIPLYNKAKWVGRAVDSVLRQTWPHFELIVVDDGSRDDGPEILARHVDSRLTVIRQANQGPGAARNNGWRRGSGTVVAFLDADDYWEPGYLEWGINTLLEHPDVGACTCVCRELTGNGPPIDSSSDWRRLGIPDGPLRITPETPMARFRSVLTYMFPVSTMVRRDILGRFGGFYDSDRCTYGEDSFFWLRVLLNYPVYLSAEARVVVDRTASSLSTLETLGTRSLEPVLAAPDEIRRACPSQLSALLATLLADKAFKRCCTLAAVGRWREAARLRSRFVVPGSWRLRYGLAALLVVNPVGGAIATVLLRLLRRATELLRR